MNLPPPQRAYTSRRPRGSAASLLRELKYTMRVLAPCANGTAARHAIELAQAPPGLGARALPRPLRRGLEVPERAASRVEPACRGQDASLRTLPATSLLRGPSEGGSGLPDGAGVPWLLDSCSAILTKAARNKKTVRQQRSACAHRSRSECQLRPACRSSAVRARHRQCACARRDQTCTLRLLHVWGNLTLITPDRDDCSVARSR